MKIGKVIVCIAFALSCALFVGCKNEPVAKEDTEPQMTESETVQSTDRADTESTRNTDTEPQMTESEPAETTVMIDLKPITKQAAESWLGKYESYEFFFRRRLCSDIY